MNAIFVRSDKRKCDEVNHYDEVLHRKKKDILSFDIWVSKH
jgi:hypothetical protein